MRMGMRRFLGAVVSIALFFASFSIASKTSLASNTSFTATVAAGSSHALAADNGGSLYAWGYNPEGLAPDGLVWFFKITQF
jgi:hypothetical protein